MCVCVCVFTYFHKQWSFLLVFFVDLFCFCDKARYLAVKLAIALSQRNSTLWETTLNNFTKGNKTDYAEQKKKQKKIQNAVRREKLRLFSPGYALSENVKLSPDEYLFEAFKYAKAVSEQRSDVLPQIMSVLLVCLFVCLFITLCVCFVFF